MTFIRERRLLVILLPSAAFDRGGVYSRTAVYRIHTVFKNGVNGKIAESQRGHSTNVFCKMYFRRNKNCLEVSIAWGRIKISRGPLHSCTVSEASLIDFLKFNFSHFTPLV